MTRDEFGREAVAQPLAQPETAESSRHPLHDWTERTRSSALEALRYTRYVGFMKRALPLAAAAILVTVVAYWVSPRHQQRISLGYEKIGTLRNDLAMIKPRLTGTDTKGNPYTITADAAIQDSPGSHRATLKQVQADVQLDGGHWLTASAATGLVDKDAGTLKLRGGISLYTDSGYELHTQSADADLKSNIFRGTELVKGHGPLGSLSADRFQIDRLKRHMKLNGHVHMVMYPNKAKRR
ncbi:MAG: LPS export ABC transporter periplasmic protein LptC [Alphaproteobacteria bacterium]|nr:LPS export ABC transporter periplasmic protein LptC [Alphaproteobacteria bacterium]MDE2630468.1 LPS export ABC transporter periplasmic protein LptC [Alphaproteobacteria bacterium]